MCVNFMHHKEINYNNLHIRFNVIYIKCYIVLLQQKLNVHSIVPYIEHSKYYYNEIYSSLRTFSATSFKSLSTTSSIMEFAMFIMSSTSFVSGSARGLYGFSGGDSSAEVGKIDQFEVTKQVPKLKNQKIIPIRLSCSAASSACLASARAPWMSFSLFL